MIQAAIVSILTGNEPLAAVISDRVYPMFVPVDGEFPCLTYSTNIDFSDSVSGKNISNANITITAWSRSYSTSLSLAALVMNALHRFQGTAAEVNIRGIFRNSQNDIYEIGESVDDLFFGIQLTFDVKYVD